MPNKELNKILSDISKSNTPKFAAEVGHILAMGHKPPLGHTSKTDDPTEYSQLAAFLVLEDTCFV